jgi:hypothetical protein
MVSVFSIASGSAETIWVLRGAGIANAILSCPVLFCTARAISISVVEKACFCDWHIDALHRRWQVHTTIVQGHTQEPISNSSAKSRHACLVLRRGTTVESRVSYVLAFLTW